MSRHEDWDIAHLVARSSSDGMPSRDDGLLEKGNWADMKPMQPLWRHARRVRRWKLDDFLPFFITQNDGQQDKQQPEKVRPTAYLDGLRGFAAFMVYWHHHQLWAHDNSNLAVVLERGFGHEKKYYLACFPGIRLLFTPGHLAVSVFFVISGYVLSTKPLSLIHTNEHGKLGDNVASALFRRWLRLYLPFIATTVLYLTSWHLFGLWTVPAERKGSYRDEIWNWYAEFKNYSFVFNTGGEPMFSYNFHLWSIPVEFKGSIVIYTSLLAFSRCTRNARLLCEVALITYFMYIADGAYFAMFTGGMLLCDLDMLAKSKQLPRFFYAMENFKELIFCHLLVISIYFGGIPSHDQFVKSLQDSPGWYYLSFLKPQAVYDYKWFYLFWAAMFLVASVPRIPILKRFFDSPFNQYFGRISYALYLVHGPVLWTLGDRLYLATGWVRDVHKQALPWWVNRLPISKTGPLGMELSFIAPHLILLPFTLWMAEIVMKWIDTPSLNFSTWLYGKMIPSRPTKH